MDIDLRVAEASEQPVLANLIELYRHDFTEFDGEDIEDDGRFGYDKLPLYWSERLRFPYLLRCDGKLAGFALVRRASHFDEAAQDVMDIVEFFVMRKYRRHGAGGEMARRLFDTHDGPWEVRVMAENAPAQAFWRRTIGAYAHGRFREQAYDEDHWRGPVFFFEGRARDA